MIISLLVFMFSYVKVLVKHQNLGQVQLFYKKS